MKTFSPALEASTPDASAHVFPNGEVNPDRSTLRYRAERAQAEARELHSLMADCAETHRRLVTRTYQDHCASAAAEAHEYLTALIYAG